MNENEHDHAGVIAPPPLIFAGAFLVGWLLNRLAPAPLLPRKIAPFVGIPLLGVAFAGVGWAFRTMQAANTPVEPHKPVTAIVTQGPYEYTRNPIYLSMIMAYTGLASLLNCRAAMILLPVAVMLLQFGVIEREEGYLEGKFGPEYTGYKGRVPRWL